MEKSTRDHNEIKNWVEKHEGVPEVIDDLEAGSDDAGLRINFPTTEDDAFLDTATHGVEWKDWFDIFDDQGLIFVYSEDEYSNSPSLSYHFERTTE